MTISQAIEAMCLVWASVGFAVFTIYIFRLPKAQEIIFPYGDDFDKLITKLDMANGEPDINKSVLKETQFKVRLVEACFALSLSLKGITNAWLLMFFSFLFFFSFWWFRTANS